MLIVDRRAVLATLGATLIVGPVRAQSRATTPAGFTGQQPECK